MTVPPCGRPRRHPAKQTALPRPPAGPCAPRHDRHPRVVVQRDLRVGGQAEDAEREVLVLVDVEVGDRGPEGGRSQQAAALLAQSGQQKPAHICTRLGRKLFRPKFSHRNPAHTARSTASPPRSPPPPQRLASRCKAPAGGAPGPGVRVGIKPQLAAALHFAPRARLLRARALLAVLDAQLRQGHRACGA